MEHSVILENYRGFPSYTLKDLSRVNLLVGKNNCGKSAILEGIHFLESGGNPGVLADIAMRRGETVVRFDEETAIEGTTSIIPSVTHFFPGHKLTSGSSFSIYTEGNKKIVSVSIESLEESEYKNLRSIGFEEEETWSFGMIIDSVLHGENNVALIPLVAEGALTRQALKAARRVWNRILTLSEPSFLVPTEFISPNSLEPFSLFRMWDTVTKEGKEVEVIHALQIIDPRISDIRFLTGGGRVSGSFAGILVELDGKSTERVPLGSFGDGLRRLLALSISMIQSSKGVLLIDEIDTGLHFSVMEKLWRFIIDAARVFDVQVFATTHSLDCLRGMAQLFEDSPEYGAEASLQRITTDLPESVPFSANEIAIAMRQELEVR